MLFSFFNVNCVYKCCALGAGKLGGGSRERHLVSPRGRAGQGALLATSIAGAVVRGGLRELREEIADLEGKILRRLGSGRASPSREASGTEEARHSTTVSSDVSKQRGSSWHGVSHRCLDCCLPSVTE